jgi:hypothetical protein
MPLTFASHSDLEARALAADRHATRIQFLDRHAHAVFAVLAVGCEAAGKWGNVADADYEILRVGRGAGQHCHRNENRLELHGSTPSNADTIERGTPHVLMARRNRAELS